MSALLRITYVVFIMMFIRQINGRSTGNKEMIKNSVKKNVQGHSMSHKLISHKQVQYYVDTVNMKSSVACISSCNVVSNNLE